jgi:hypothetical protein
VVAEAKRLRNKNEIRKYVDHKFKVDGGFALERPISVLNVISEGIMFFSK